MGRDNNWQYKGSWIRNCSKFIYNYDQMQKILVVDDQQDMVLMIKTILAKKGFEIETDLTGNLVEHLEETDYPDLIILDINLGNKNGGIICRDLKSRESTKHIPIIMVSSDLNLLNISRTSGAEDFLAKPFKSKDLVYKVLSILNAA
jgi:CheY-like chemotaxis protein